MASVKSRQKDAVLLWIQIPKGLRLPALIGQSLVRDSLF